jgi:CRP-like cAMP-binding protein
VESTVASTGIQAGEAKVEGTSLKRFEAGQELFRQGETSREMYIVRSGKVAVLITRNGKTVPVVELGKGAFVGEMSFLSGIPRTATVKAVEPVIASRLGVELLGNGAYGVSDWAYSITKILVERLRKTTILLGDYRSTSWGAGQEDGGVQDPAQSADEGFAVRDLPLRDGRRLFVSGSLLKDEVPRLRETVRLYRVKHPGPLVLDFSGVVDLDNEGLGYLYDLLKGKNAEDKKVSIENFQLVQNKVLAIKGIQRILKSTEAPVRWIDAGELLIKQGEPGSSLYVVKTGSFTVFRTVEGAEIALGTAESGDVLGEMSLIEQGLRSASVKATKPASVYEIKTKDFYKNIYNVPEWFMRIIKGLVVRLRQTNEMIDYIVKERDRKDLEQEEVSLPMGITVDAKNPGLVVVTGSLTAGNLEFLTDLIDSRRRKGATEITIDLAKVERIDEKSIVYLLNLFMDLKAQGGKLSLRGPQREILLLFKQYDIEI